LRYCHQTEEKTKFHLADNGRTSSSIFDLALHIQFWANGKMVDTIDLKTKTLEEAVGSGEHFEGIIIDPRGAKLILFEAKLLLQSVRYVKAEVADFRATLDKCESH
jgi:hypothetical protein